MDKSSQIVMLHGWGCDSRVWEPLLTFLETFADVKLISIRYEHNNVASTVDELCHSIAEQIDDNSVLCGWSLGGMLATQIAAQYPRKVKALITLASNLVFVENQFWPQAMPNDTFSAFFALFKKNPEQALKRFLLLETHGDKQSKLQLPFLQSFSKDLNFKSLDHGLSLLEAINNLESIKKITCPALFCFAENDALVPIAAASALKKKINGSPQLNQQVKIVAGSGHLIHYPIEKVDGMFNSFLLGLN